MVEAAEPRTRGNLRKRRRLTFHGPLIGRVLTQSIMCPVIVVVGQVIADQPPQMRFVQCNDVVKDLAATASDPALRNPVLPRCPNTDALRLKAGCLQEGDHIGIEFGVVVKDDITIVPSLGKRLTRC
jgi:hypothetical protein